MENAIKEFRPVSEAMSSIDEEIVGWFKVKDLRAKFNEMTAGMDNWKMPFTVKASVDEVAKVTTAITFFTGDNNPTVTWDKHEELFTVSTVGYYGAVGA